MTTVFRVAWFGDSIMEHLEGYAAPLFDQAALPAVGSAVTVESWRHRGYVERLRLSLLADWPGLDFRFGNHAVGGATSRDLLPIVERVTQEAPEAPGADIAFLGCGVNDAWPAFSAAAGHPGARPAGPRGDAGLWSDADLWSDGTLWSDGVHLSELGDTIVLHAVERHLRETRLIGELAGSAP